MPQSVNGFSLAPSASLLLPLSLSPSVCHTLSLCNFYYYLHLVMRCAYVCFCVSVRVIFMSIAISCTHTHRQPHTLLRGVHTHTVCNFGASILIDCQTSIWGNKREEFKALLTYVNRGLCAELKFIHRAANYLENFINEGQLFEPQIKY